MNTYKFLFLASATVLCLTLNSCEENLPPLPEAVNPNVEATADAAEGNTYTDVQPTVIDPKNNVYGYITDKTTGKGVPNVPVTDGYHYTKTDKNGCYQFVADSRARNIYYSTPADYKIEVNTKKMPAFFSTTQLDFTKQNRIDFTLEKLNKDETNFTFVAISDPQCKYTWHADRFRDESIPDFQSTFNNGSWRNIYGMTLGDILYDDHSLWGTMQSLLGNITINKDYGYFPIFNCIGNHDHNYNYANVSDYASTITYVNYFGPTDYSFNRGKAHIVVMDNVVAYSLGNNTCNYYAGYNEEQLAWLKEDLACVPNKEEMLLIFVGHIPFRNGATDSGGNVNKTRHYSDVLNLMTDFNEAHIMIGHTHYPQFYAHNGYKTRNGQPIFEHVHAAICGGWWWSNLCTDGTPNGYAIYEVTGNTIKNYYSKATGKSIADSQIRVYNGNETYSDFTWDWGTTSWTQDGNSFTSNNLKGKVIADVFYGDADNWKVDLIYNGATYPMTQVTVSQRDWNTYSFFINKCGRSITNTSWMSQKMHYWTVTAPNGNPATLTNWQVVATHTIPGSGIQNVYTTSTMQNGYKSYIYTNGTTRTEF